MTTTEQIRWYVIVVFFGHFGPSERRLLRAYSAADVEVQVRSMSAANVASRGESCRLLCIEPYEPDTFAAHAELREREASILRGDLPW